MMPPPYSKVASPSNCKVASESFEQADSIRRSWTQQTSCDIPSAEQFPQLTKTNKNTKRDVNRNHQRQKDFQNADQASSSRNTPSFSSSKSSSVSVSPSQNSQSLKKSMVISKPPDSLPLHAKTDLLHSLVGMPKPRVSLEQALASAEQCPVMDKTGLLRFLSARSEDVRTTDDLLQRFQKRMKVVRQIGGRGVVHSMESEVKWIVLGEEEEQKRYGGVGSRTRQATKKILSWIGDGEDVRREAYSQMEEKQATSGAKNVSHDNIDCDSSFNEEDWYVKKEEKPCSREEGGNSDEDWYRKPKPSSSFVSAESSYLNTFGKITRSTLNNLVTLGNLTITAVAGNATEEKAPEEQLTVVCDKDEVEEVGTCPMCQEEMEMKALMDHAGYCEG